MRKLTIILTSGFLTLSLSGCGTTVVTETEYIKEKIPSDLTRSCEIPEFKGETTEDMILWVEDMKSSLKSCNSRFKSIREFQK